MGSELQDLPAAIGIISSGRGENLRYILKAERSGYLPAEVRIVLADQPEAGALKIAREFGVRSLCINHSGRSREDYDQLMIQHLDSVGVDLVVLTGYMRILSSSFVEHYPNRILNIHPALLPSFRGMNALQKALDYGVKWTGTTIHIVDTQIDKGPIIFQVPVPIRENDTFESLKARVQRAEYKAYPRAIKMFLEGRHKVVGRKFVFQKEAD